MGKTKQQHAMMTLQQNGFLRKCATEAVAAAAQCLAWFFLFFSNVLAVDRDTINATRSDPLCRSSSACNLRITC
jgi:hypothetical protein